MKKLMNVILAIVVTITLAITIYNSLTISNHHRGKYKEYTYAYDCIREAELNYHKTKAILCEEVQNYISSIAPTSNLRGYAIVEECERYNIDIKFVLAQGEIESHYATKGIGGKINNVFNVGVFDGLSDINVKNTYKYDSPNESIRPYLELLSTRYLVNKLEEDLMDNYVDINGNRYATDLNYERKLREKFNLITTSTKIDSLQNQLHNYAIKCNRN